MNQVAFNAGQEQTSRMKPGEIQDQAANRRHADANNVTTFFFSGVAGFCLSSNLCAPSRNSGDGSAP